MTFTFPVLIDSAAAWNRVLSNRYLPSVVLIKPQSTQLTVESETRWGLGLNATDFPAANAVIFSKVSAFYL